MLKYLPRDTQPLSASLPCLPFLKSFKPHSLVTTLSLFRRLSPSAISLSWESLSLKPFFINFFCDNSSSGGHAINSESLLGPSSASVQDRVEKLKPSSFASRVFLAREKKNNSQIIYRRSRIVARRSACAEVEVIPVLPEDVPKLLTLAIT